MNYLTVENNRLCWHFRVILLSHLKVRYAKDCQDLYGRILDAPLINPANKDVAIQATMERWLNRYGDEPYNVDVDTSPFESGSAKLVQTNDASENGAAIDSETQQMKSRRITYDLADAVSRQKTFYFQVSFPAADIVSHWLNVCVHILQSTQFFYLMVMCRFLNHSCLKNVSWDQQSNDIRGSFTYLQWARDFSWFQHMMLILCGRFAHCQ